MTQFITIGKGKDRRRVPVDGNTPTPHLGRSTDHKKKWSARDYLMDKYGKEAFNEDGTIRREYLDRAIREAGKEHRSTLMRKLERTKNLTTGAEERIYYIEWQPRGFPSEKEYIRVKGKKNAEALESALSEYEQNNESRSTVRASTAKKAASSVKNGNVADGDQIIKMIRKNPEDFRDEPEEYRARKLRRYWEEPQKKI